MTLDVRVPVTKAGRIRLVLAAEPDLNKIQLASRLGLPRREIRGILDRNPMWHRKTVNQSA